MRGVAKTRTQLSDFTLTFHFPALEKEMATHSSIHAWRIPMDRGAWKAIVHWVAKSQTQLSTKIIKWEIDSNTVTLRNFNTPLETMDRSSRQKINKEIQAWMNTLDQMNLTYIYKKFHPKSVEFIFFSSAYATFSRIDHILGHKLSLGKFFKNWDHFKHLFWSQLRYQLQEKIKV